MNVRWMAVLTGFIVDILATFLFYAIFYPASIVTPDPSPPSDPLQLGLGLLATGIGGYVAGRMAPAQRTLHGLLVGVVGILVIQLQMAVSSGAAITQTQVIALAVGCLIGALGGLLSNLPPQQQPRK